MPTTGQANKLVMFVWQRNVAQHFYCNRKVVKFHLHGSCAAQVHGTTNMNMLCQASI